jgi:hypothetical protein
VPLVHFQTALLQTIALSLRKLYYPEEIEDNKNRRNDEQRVNPTASAWKSWANVAAKKAKEPQYY